MFFDPIKLQSISKNLNLQDFVSKTDFIFIFNPQFAL